MELMALIVALDVSLFRIPGDRVGQVNSLLILEAYLHSIQTCLLNFLDGLRTGTIYILRRSSSCTVI